MTPIATVLMSVYNGDKFLRQCIDSILSQTFTDFEFVIYDDCSTDSTPEIIQSYTDSRIIYRRNSRNRGLTANLAEGVELSTSKYIIRMDADDIAYSDRFEKQVKWMDSHENISILGSPVTYFCDAPGDGGISQQPENDATIKAMLFINFTLMHPSIIIRRDDLVKHGLNYNTEYRYSQDHALYLDCICSGLKFANFPQPLVYMRAHLKSISRFNHSEQQECSKRARREFLERSGIIEGCTEQEVLVYNNFASGEFPNTPSEVEAFENFVDKIVINSLTARYFDINILRNVIAEQLYNSAYHAVNKKELKQAAVRARRSSLAKYVRPWPFSQRVKFEIKKYINL